MSRRRIKADLAIIGAGAAGLSVAAGAAQLGLKVVLFERGEMGGDCLNTGCVPSKALLAAAEAAHAAREAGRLGVTVQGVAVDFPAVMAHVKGAIATIAPVDSQERFEGLGCTVIRESARFAGPRAVESDSVRVEARRVVLAVGGKPAVPPVPGIEHARPLTSETVWDLQTLPRRLVILGAGPIGCELGQAFARLGASVVLVDPGRALGKEDPDLAEVVLGRLRADGVELRESARPARFEPRGEGFALVLEDGGVIEGDRLLVATGRKVALDGLNPEAAGVEVRDGALVVDDRLRTTNRRVSAIGDAAGRGQFTHLAGAHAALFVRQALFAQPIDATRLVVPRVTYTDPELAVVGLTESEARARHGDGIKVVRVDNHHVDRAVAEGDTRGFAKLITDRKGRILGAAIVGRGAGDAIAPLILAMSAGLKLTALTGMIAPYPTRGELAKRLAGAWYTPVLFSDRTRALVSLLKRFG